MKTKMLNLRWPLLVRTGALLLLLSVLRLGLITARADAVSELASFSIFDKVDLAQLAKSDVKTAHGPPMSNPRFLAVQSCYVVTGAPAQQIEALRRWDATRHRELKVFLHSDLPSNPSAANFEKLRNAPSNPSVRSFVAATQKLSSNLQISKDGEEIFCGNRRRRWPDTCTSGNILGRCIECADEKLRVGRNVRTTSVRSRRPICSGKRRSKRIVARARKTSQSVFKLTWSHRYWARCRFAQAGVVLGAPRCG